jgi:hypothetical protein
MSMLLPSLQEDNTGRRPSGRGLSRDGVPNVEAAPCSPGHLGPPCRSCPDQGAVYASKAASLSPNDPTRPPHEGESMSDDAPTIKSDVRHAPDFADDVYPSRLPSPPGDCRGR